MSVKSGLYQELPKDPQESGRYRAETVKATDIEEIRVGQVRKSAPTMLSLQER